MLTQLVTLTGAGAWFPYAAPGMWSGMGGTALAVSVLPIQLLLALPVGLAGVLATTWWWDRAEVA
jgi:ABC-2 type transport system permease protein